MSDPVKFKLSKPAEVCIDGEPGAATYRTGFRTDGQSTVDLALVCPCGCGNVYTVALDPRRQGYMWNGKPDTPTLLRLKPREDHTAPDMKRLKSGELIQVQGQQETEIAQITIAFVNARFQVVTHWVGTLIDGLWITKG